MAKKKDIKKKDTKKKDTKKKDDKKYSSSGNFKVTETNCAPCQNKKDARSNKVNKFKSCYSKDSLMKIGKIWNETNSTTEPIKFEKKTRKGIWDQIEKRFHKQCNNNESCWKRQDIIKKLKDITINSYTFKPDYPKEWIKNKYTWLNTYDIYYVMKQYQKADKHFAFLGPIPSDCPTKIQCELSNLDLESMNKNKINKIGIIYNLDISSGPGTHWVAMYIDNKRNEINYYDSYGELPIPLIQRFINNLVKKYIASGIDCTVIYNDKRHQYGGSECGMYSMNFILERLNGTTMYDISKMNIPDENMNHLRKLLYNTI
jgi:hypothetical protein